MARAGPGLGGTARKQVLFFDREILLSERFKAGRPNGIGYKMPQPEFRAANEFLAEQAVEDIVEVLQERIRETGRPQRETEYLVNALKDPRNIDFDAKGFTVGMDDFLQQSKAGRYFRNLEYGSRVFVGRVIEGFFAGPSGRPIEPGQGRAVEGAKDALRLVQTGAFTNPADKPSGRYQYPDRPSRNPSRSARTAGEFTIRGGGVSPDLYNVLLPGSGNHRGPSRPITIRNPIPAYHYFSEGIAAFQRRARGPGGLIAQAYADAARAFIDRGGLIIE